jgi:uncharacterized protein
MRWRPLRHFDILTEPGNPVGIRARVRGTGVPAGLIGQKHLTAGMELEGVVTNIVAFGAFVDVGVHEDGLVHVSQLADRYVSDPNAVVRVGQKVRVRVVSVDLPRNRIALTMKKGAAEPPRAKQPPRRRGHRRPAT